MEKILVLDDMEQCHEIVREALSDEYVVISAYTTEEANQKIGQENPDLAIIDVNLDISRPELTQGLDLIGRIRKSSIPIPIVCVSKCNHRENARKAGADEFIFKKEFYRGIKLYIQRHLGNEK